MDSNVLIAIVLSAALVLAVVAWQVLSIAKAVMLRAAADGREAPGRGREGMGR